MATLNDLQDVDFDSYDVQQVKDGLVSAYEQVSGRTLAPGDPIRLFLLTIAAVVVQQNYTIDRAAKQNLLKYATGDYLDQLGALTDTDRTPAAQASTTLTFTLSAKREDVVTVPAGTRVTRTSSCISPPSMTSLSRPGALPVRSKPTAPSAVPRAMACPPGLSPCWWIPCLMWQKSAAR